MESRLDPEQLGVFTMNSFLGEFYPGEPSNDTVTTFTIFHYNGYMRSSSSGKVSCIDNYNYLLLFVITISTGHTVFLIHSCSLA